MLNLIIGKNILPVRLEASTKKVCRIQYSDRLSVSTTNLKGQTTEVATFENADQMKNALKDVIDNIENDIKYVDIRYPVGMLRVSFPHFSMTYFIKKKKPKYSIKRQNLVIAY